MNDIQLVITDVVMPGEMSGLDLGQRIIDDKPRVKIIYCTGYSADVIRSAHPMIEGENFLAKPYDAQSLMLILNRLFPKPVGKPATARLKSPSTRRLTRSLERTEAVAAP
jgi:FixJ family two-component response regulator